jgi:hypothetical protein
VAVRWRMALLREEYCQHEGVRKDGVNRISVRNAGRPRVHAPSTVPMITVGVPTEYVVKERDVEVVTVTRPGQCDRGMNDVRMPRINEMRCFVVDSAKLERSLGRIESLANKCQELISLNSERCCRVGENVGPLLGKGHEVLRGECTAAHQTTRRSK